MIRCIFNRIGVGWAFAVVAIGIAYGEEAEEKELPNIMLVVIDSLRYDHLGCYSYERDNTPFIDQMAAEGVLFERAYSTSSWTTPSVMSMFTSVLPRMHTLISMSNRLPEDCTTLATELRKLGYATIGVSVNPCGAGHLGFDRGFDLFDDYSVLLDIQLNVFDVMGIEQRKSLHETTTSAQLTDLALAHLRKVPEGKPWFLFLFYFDPHADYVPPRRYVEMFDPDYAGDATGKVVGKEYTYVFENPRDLEHVKALYDGEIRFTDDQFRRFAAAAADEGLLGDNLLTLIVSDHGEEFNDHGGIQHGRTLYEEVVRVPMIMHWPRVLPAGRRVKQPVQLIDIMPTLLSALKADVPEQCFGANLLPVISGESFLVRPLGLHVKSVGHKASVMNLPYKAILDLPEERVSIYDLKNDPLERDFLHPDAIGESAEASDLVKRLAEWNNAMELQYRRRTEIAGDDEKPQLTPQQIEALRSMGYLH